MPLKQNSIKKYIDRLTSQAEKLFSEEQAGFRKGRSTTEQIFNCRNIIEKHLERQKDLYHNFIYFKKLLIEFATRDSGKLSINMASTLI